MYRGDACWKAVLIESLRDQAAASQLVQRYQCTKCCQLHRSSLYSLWHVVQLQQTDSIDHFGIPFNASYGLDVPKKLEKTCSGPETASKVYPVHPVPVAHQHLLRHADLAALPVVACNVSCGACCGMQM